VIVTGDTQRVACGVGLGDNIASDKANQPSAVDIIGMQSGKPTEPQQDATCMSLAKIDARSGSKWRIQL